MLNKIVSKTLIQTIDLNEDIKTAANRYGVIQNTWFIRKGITMQATKCDRKYKKLYF